MRATSAAWPAASVGGVSAESSTTGVSIAHPGEVVFVAQAASTW